MHTVSGSAPHRALRRLSLSATIAVALATVPACSSSHALPSVVTVRDGVTASSTFCVQALSTMAAMRQNDARIAGQIPDHEVSRTQVDVASVVTSDLDSLITNVGQLAKSAPADIASYFPPVEKALHDARAAVHHATSKDDPMKIASTAMESLRFPERVLTAYIRNHCGFDFVIGAATAGQSPPTT